jgi:hypothetical protein
VMARVAVDMWGSSIVAFSREIQKLLTAEIAENFQSENAEKVTLQPPIALCGHSRPWPSWGHAALIVYSDEACRALLDWTPQGGCPHLLRVVNILKHR